MLGSPTLCACGFYGFDAKRSSVVDYMSMQDLAHHLVALDLGSVRSKVKQSRGKHILNPKPEIIVAPDIRFVKGSASWLPASHVGRVQG